MLLGPLYHLTSRNDRLRALREARRVLREGGVLLAAAISRFASALDGIRAGYIADPVFREIVRGDLRTGQHVAGESGYFIDTFFHHPDELRSEVAEAGFRSVDILGIEGPGWMSPSFAEQWEDEDQRAFLLEVAAAVEREPTMVGASSHLMAVARR